MNFRTSITIPKCNHPIDYYSKVVTLGSCFSKNIGAKFEQYKFQHYNNPFGILFQPDAIENVLMRAIEMRLFTEEDLFFENEFWHCFEVHSVLNNPDKEDMLLNLNGILKYLNGQLQTCSHLIITLGTAWTYRFSHTQKRVANCHKIPQSNFAKELLTVEEITTSLINIQTKLTEFNPEIKFIFTVSPVRHIKDGFVENQVSKSHLFAGLHSSISYYTNSSYFPSYEMMMDDLRDYRFYSEDMLHPNQTAIDYIWNHFMTSHISHHVRPIMLELDSIQKGLNHRSFNPNSEQHQLFVQKLHERIEQLQEKYPFLQLM